MLNRFDQFLVRECKQSLAHLSCEGFRCAFQVDLPFVANTFSLPLDDDVSSSLLMHCLRPSAGFPASREPHVFQAVQQKSWCLPINDVMGMVPSRITQIEGAALLLIIVQEDSLLAVLVLEVASIDVGEGLLVDPWRYATGFSLMIGDLKKQLVPHQSFGASSVPCRSQVITPFLSARTDNSRHESCLFWTSTSGSPANGKLLLPAVW